MKSPEWSTLVSSLSQQRLDSTSFFERQRARTPQRVTYVAALYLASTIQQLVDALTSASTTPSTAPTESAGTAVSNTELEMETPGERIMFAVLDRDGRVYGAAKSAATLFKNEGAARNKARNDGDTVIRVRLDLRAEPVFIRKKVL